jgi:SEC-C motif
VSGIGRNEPCWCGSGKKYKKCHIDRDKQPAAKPWEVDALLRSERDTGKCLHVDESTGVVCGKPAIASHSVPKKMLKQIARDGHVYYHSGTVQDIAKAQGRPSLKLIGVNKASTLPLFCSAHDSAIFEPLEQVPFTGTPEQCFLLAYRAVCNEYLKKRNQFDTVELLKTADRGKPLSHQVEIQAEIEAYAMAVRASVRDMAHHKQEFDSVLAGANFSRLRAYIVTFENVPEVLCSGVLYPECDFAGQTVQYMGNLTDTLELVTHSLVTTENGGAFVFAWLESSDAASRQLAASLNQLSDEQLPHAVLRFVFEFCENHYLSPAWWDGLDATIRSAILDRFAKAASPTELRLHNSCLRDDGIRAVSWQVIGRSWIPQCS